MSRRCAWRANAWSAAGSGVGVDGSQGELFHLGGELAQAAGVGDPGLVVAGLFVGEPDGDGFAVDLAGPAPPGAVQGGRVGVAAAAGRAAAAVAAE